jgi:hypothetical protein
MKISGVILLMFAFLYGKQPTPNPASRSPSPAGCVLVAKTDVWLNVYQADDKGNSGLIVFTDLALKQNDIQRVPKVPTDKIIYEYKLALNEVYRGGTHVACVDGGRVFVPER